MGKVITIPSWMRAPSSIKSDADIPANTDMSISGQDITCSNITTALIKSVLGASTNSVSALCTHSSINKWSPYRPGGWKANGSSGSVWLPTGSSQPNFVINIPAPYNMGDFALYDHLAGQLPTYYDTTPVNKIFERGDTQTVAIRLKRGFRKPVCEDQGALSSAWEKLKTSWDLSDTSWGTETALGTTPAGSGAPDTVPGISDSPNYLEHVSPALGLSIGAGVKYLHIRPYYVSGTSTKESMIEAGHYQITVQAVEVRCTASITSISVNSSHPVNKQINVYWSVSRDSGAPTKDIEIKVSLSTNENSAGYDFSSSPVEDIDLVGSMSGGDTITGNVTQVISASTSPSQANNNMARIYLRIQGNTQWSFMGNAIFNWT